MIGSLRELLVAPEDPAAVLERIAHPDTRIVSLTVTEKGYCHDPATGALRLDDPDIAHDLAHPACAAQRDRLHRARPAAAPRSAARRRSR